MIKSIINYLKLWFKCDFSLLSDVKQLKELQFKFEQLLIKSTEGFKAKSPERDFLSSHRNSVNMNPNQMSNRQDLKYGQKMLAENKSMKDINPRSPGKQSEGNFLTSSLSNKISSPLKFTHQSSSEKDPMKNKTTANSDKVDDYEHRTFNNTNQNAMMIQVNKSQGVKSGAYYPNKTTSNKSGKHHIVAMIN